MVARTGGAGAVGSYALLRMLPGLVGVLCVAGLPGALAYFLAPTPRRGPAAVADAARDRGRRRRARDACSGCWPAPLALAALFFPDDPLATVARPRATVADPAAPDRRQDLAPGPQDRRGGDLVIAAEEIAFLPCYLLPPSLACTAWPGS